MQAVRPFVERDISAVDAEIRALRARGWLRSARDDNAEVSELGIAAHERAAERVSAIRERLRVAVLFLAPRATHGGARVTQQ